MMLRSTRKASTKTGEVLSDAATTTTTAVVPLRNGGPVAPFFRKHPDSSRRKHHLYHDAAHTTFSQGTLLIISHLLTSLATVFLMLMISSGMNHHHHSTDNVATTNAWPRGMHQPMENSNERLLRRAARPNHNDEHVDRPYYDVVVVGSGPAGLTAAIFAARAGLQVLVVGSETGQLSQATTLDNYPSWFDEYAALQPPQVQIETLWGGMSWLATTKTQAVATGVDFVRPGLQVSQITRESHDVDLTIFSLNISGSMVDSRTVILATGATGRKLNIPNEELLWGKSIHSCAICDGSSYTKNQTVVVVGGGDAAVDAAILLSRHAGQVVVIHRADTFRASNQRNLQALWGIPMLQIKTPFVVVEFLLTNDEEVRLLGVKIRNTRTNQTETLECDGAFVMIGSIPNTQFVQDLVSVTEEGLIETSLDTRSDQGSTTQGTSVPGVFAAGEMTDQQYYKQAITAAAAGARAAIDAERWLRQSDVTSHNRRQGRPSHIPMQSFGTGIVPVDHGTQRNQVESKETLKSNLECNDFTNLDCINTIVEKHPVVMFSKSKCPYCVQALEMLQMEGVLKSDILVINIDVPGDEEKIKSNLDRISGRRTVPNVFIGGKNIGGMVLLGRLQVLGELYTKLEKANAFQRPGSVSDEECNDFRRMDCIEAVVRQYPVVMFSKSWCPYCKKALEAFALEGVTGPPSMFVVNLDELDAQSIQSNLARMTGRRTVPNIFIGGSNIGGGDETVQLQVTGALRTLLINAQAISDK